MACCASAMAKFLASFSGLRILLNFYRQENDSSDNAYIGKYRDGLSEIDLSHTSFFSSTERARF